MPLTPPALEHEEEHIGLLSQRPPWLVRWGIMLFFVWIVALLGITWFIRYPDRVSAGGTLMATNPPRELVVRSQGRLLRLLHGDGHRVDSGAIVAVMETTANYKTVVLMQQMADSLQACLDAGNTEAALPWYGAMQAANAGGHMGELQAGHQQVMHALQQFTQYLSSGYYVRRKAMLRADMLHIAQQREVVNSQLRLARQDAKLAQLNFDAHAKLAEQQVLAPVEYRLEQSKWLGKQMQVPQLEAAAIAGNVQQQEKLKEIAQLENDIAQQKALFAEALLQWRASLAAWQQQYLLVAPCSGTLVFASFFEEGVSLSAGSKFGSVQPEQAGYYIAATLPQYNFGKLHTGQQALLRFAAYPYEEYGAVPAVLHHIKPLPTDSGYLARLTLPNGLTTYTGNTLAYSHGLHANVEIITDNRRLLHRLLDAFTRHIVR